MSNAYAVGEESTVIGFTCVGIQPVPVGRPEELLPALRKLLADADTALVLLEETDVEDYEDEIEELRQKSKAVVLLIPSHRGSTGLGLSLVRSRIEKSVGVDMLRDRGK